MDYTINTTEVAIMESLHSELVDAEMDALYNYIIRSLYGIGHSVRSCRWSTAELRSLGAYNDSIVLSTNIVAFKHSQPFRSLVANRLFKLCYRDIPAEPVIKITGYTFDADF